MVNARDITERLQAAIQTEEHPRGTGDSTTFVSEGGARGEGFDIAGLKVAAATGEITLTTCRRVTGSWLLQWGMSADTALAAMLMAETGLTCDCSPKIVTTWEKSFRVQITSSEDVGKERFVTMLLVKLDVSTCSIVHCSAGHCPGYVLDELGNVKAKLKRTGMALGVMADAAYAMEGPMRLAKGDTLILLTDGLEETTNGEGELFGSQRVIEVVNENKELGAAKIVETVFETLARFSGEPSRKTITQ